MTECQKMSRHEKLRLRLQRLERDYCLMVREEFVSESEGRHSPYFDTWGIESARTDQLHRLANQINSLRRKLGENGPGPTAEVIAQFDAAETELGTKIRPHDSVTHAKRAIKELDDILKTL